MEQDNITSKNNETQSTKIYEFNVTKDKFENQL